MSRDPYTLPGDPNLPPGVTDKIQVRVSAKQRKRFSEAARLSGSGGCHVWPGPRNRAGYGVVSAGGINGKTGGALAHRVAWILRRGHVNGGLGVLHRCDNPPCVNVDHLFIGTQMDNLADAVAKGRNIRGDRSGRSKLPRAHIPWILAYRAAGFSAESIGRCFGVSGTTVSDISCGRSWAHVDSPAREAAASVAAKWRRGPGRGVR